MKVVKFKIGESFVNSSGDRAVIVGFKKGTKTRSRKAIIQFEDGTTKEVATPKLNQGIFKNNFKPSVCGVGFMGEGTYYSSKSGVDTKAYSVWNAMIRRCYCENREGLENYNNTVVCDEWHNFQNFAKWYAEQDIDKSCDYQLDKDLLGDSKLYSPQTCCLLKDNINSKIAIMKSCGYSKRHNIWTAHLGGKSIPLPNEEMARDVVLSYKINYCYNLLRVLERQNTQERVIKGINSLILKLFKEQEISRKEVELKLEE